MIYLTWGIIELVVWASLVLLLAFVWRYVGFSGSSFVMLKGSDRRSKSVMCVGTGVVLLLLVFMAFDTGSRQLTIDRTVFNRNTNVVVQEKIEYVGPTSDTVNENFEKTLKEKLEQGKHK